jgi:hypothetical protein
MKQSGPKNAIACILFECLISNFFLLLSVMIVIVILGIAVTGCSYFMTRKITTCPDVRITKNYKGQVVRPF